jgi:pyruvate/2-oxoglutarate/acetoin dehydrogenase E1 component
MTDTAPRTVLESLNRGLHQALQDDPHVFLLGEDLLDPYGGAFKVARGLSTAFPEQVLTTPISEAGITGIAGGMALRGMRPVVEIMFGDFSTLIADQVINHLAKFNGMYHGTVNVPVVIRTPMGGRRGYGPTHSQTLEKHFLGVPGLSVLAPFNLMGASALGEPGQLLYDAILNLNSPALFVENKLQYLLKLSSPADLGEYKLSSMDVPTGIQAPFYTLGIQSAPPPKVTLAAYGYMAYLAMQALQKLAYEHEIFCELLVPTQLAPFELMPLYDSVRRTGRLLTIEEGTFSLGWGAEVLARCAEVLGGGLKMARRLAAKETVVPTAPDLEADCLPDTDDIIKRVREMVKNNA